MHGAHTPAAAWKRAGGILFDFPGQAAAQSMQRPKR